MKRLLVVLSLALSACSSASVVDPSTGVSRSLPVYWHDDAHGVSCWIGWNAISCLPDSVISR